MLNLKFENYETEVPELHSKRILATQTRKEDTGEILSRTFYKYDFKPILYVKRENGTPPYWTGILIDDPSTFTDPIEINHYFKVKIEYFIREYNGYLMYGLPIENEEYEFSEGEINPSRINLYKGWFNRNSEYASYDYYVPVRTKQEFRWESANLNIAIPKPQLGGVSINNGSNTSSGGVSINNSNNAHNELVETKMAELRAKGYTTKLLAGNSTTTIINATKNIFNTGGVEDITYNLDTNEVVFKFKNIKDTGLAFDLTYFNCQIWLSKDGIEKTRLIANHEDINTVIPISPNSPPIANTDNPELKLYVEKTNPYIIIKPYIALKQNRTSDWPPFYLDTKVGDKTVIILEFIGRFFYNYNSEVIDVEIEPTLLESNYANLSDPRPPDINVGYYNFQSEDSDNRTWSAWGN